MRRSSARTRLKDLKKLNWKLSAKQGRKSTTKRPSERRRRSGKRKKWKTFLLQSTISKGWIPMIEMLNASRDSVSNSCLNFQDSKFHFKVSTSHHLFFRNKKKETRNYFQNATSKTHHPFSNSAYKVLFFSFSNNFSNS